MDADRDAALALQIHAIQHRLFHLVRRDGLDEFEQPIRWAGQG